MTSLTSLVTTSVHFTDSTEQQFIFPSPVTLSLLTNRFGEVVSVLSTKKLHFLEVSENSENRGSIIIYFSEAGLPYLIPVRRGSAKMGSSVIGLGRIIKLFCKAELPYLILVNKDSAKRGSSTIIL